MRHSDRAPSSPIPAFKLERFFARHEFTARHILCASDIEGYRMAELVAMADDQCRSLWEQLTLGYTETAGHSLLRAEISRLYSNVSPDDVLCFAGAEEAIYAAMRVLLRPADHVIVTWPGYQSLTEVAASLGAEVSRWSLHLTRSAGSPSRWVADVDELKRLIRPSTRLVITNFPHNPTGALLRADEWEELLGLVRSIDCFLFSDEVYRLLEHDPSHRLQAAVDGYPRAISLGVMSKPFGLAGLRVGWVACRDRHWLGELAAFKDYTTICNSAPSEILALIALRAREQVLARCLRIVKANLVLVADFLTSRPDRFEWTAPQGGTTAFPRWLGARPIDRLVEALVAEEGVLLLPGTLFDFPDNHFRIGLGRHHTAAALERLASVVDRAPI